MTVGELISKLERLDHAAPVFLRCECPYESVPSNIAVKYDEFRVVIDGLFMPDR